MGFLIHIKVYIKMRIKIMIKIYIIMLDFFQKKSIIISIEIHIIMCILILTRKGKTDAHSN